MAASTKKARAFRHLSKAECKPAIILASTQTGWGGGEVYLSTLAQGIRERGYPVRFIAREGSVLQRAAIAEEFSVHGLAKRGRNPWALWRLRNELQSGGPTIVHCNDSHALMASGLATFGLPNVRCVGIRHTMFPVRAPWKYNRIADRVICVSHAVADSCKKQGIFQDRISVIHAAINAPKVELSEVQRLRDQFLFSPDERLVVAVGNLMPCKGHSYLIESIARLKSVGAKIRLLIAGEGEERANLEARIRQLSLSQEVRLLGFRKDPDILLSAADVVVHPSFNEGLCLTVAAAMMLQKPIVATGVGGLRDVLGMEQRMGNHSFGPFAEIVPPKDIQAITDAIQKQLTYPLMPDRLHAAQEYALSNFTQTVMVEKTLKTYHSLWSTLGQDAREVAA